MMVRFKRGFLALLSVMLFVAVFSACSKGAEETTPQPKLKDGITTTYTIDAGDKLYLSVKDLFDLDGATGVTYDVANGDYTRLITTNPDADGEFSIEATRSGKATVTVRLRTDGTVRATASITITVPKVPATAKLPTPDNKVFGRNSGATTGSVEWDRSTQIWGNDEDDHKVAGLNFVKVYMYSSNGADAEPVAEFKVFQADLSSLDGTVKYTTRESAVGPKNYYVSIANFVNEFISKVAPDLNYENIFYFKSQFIAEGSNRAFDSELSAYNLVGMEVPKLTVSFDANGGRFGGETGTETVTAVSVARNTTVSLPAAPARPNHDFEGWYKNAAGTVAFDEESVITGATTLYAKWTPNDKGEAWALSTLPGSFVSTAGTSGNFQFDRGTTTGGYFGGKISGLSYVKVNIYKSIANVYTKVGEFKISGDGNSIITMDDAKSHGMNTGIDERYTGLAAGNRWVISEYLVGMLCEVLHAQEIKVEPGDKYQFSFELIALPDSGWTDGPESARSPYTLTVAAAALQSEPDGDGYYAPVKPLL